MSEDVTGGEAANDPMKAVADALEKAVETAADSAGDAKAALEKSLPGATRFLSGLVYSTCYSLSYGVVFPTLWVARSVPADNPVVSGLTEGAKAAVEAVDDWKNRQLAAPPVEPAPSDPS